MHIFAAAPNALVFHLGQQFQAIAACVVYEYDFDRRGNKRCQLDGQSTDRDFPTPRCLARKLDARLGQRLVEQLEHESISKSQIDVRANKLTSRSLGEASLGQRA